MFSRMARISVAVVMFSSAVYGAEQAPTKVGKDTGLIARSVFFGNPDKALVKLSPDGKQISYLAPVNGVMNVHVGPANQPDAAKPVTKDTKRGIRQYYWAFTNQHIIYLQDEGGNEDFHAYRVDLTSGDIMDLTPEKKIRAMLDDPRPEFPNDLIIGINNRVPQFHDLYRVNLITGDRTLLAKNDQFAGFQIDHDMKVRFAQKMMPDGGMAILQADGNGGWKDFLTIPMEDTLTSHPVTFNKSGDVMFVVDSRGRDTGALMALDLKTGKQTMIAQDPRCDAGTVLMHPTEHKVQGVSFNYDRQRWEFTDQAVKQDFDVLRKIADGDIMISSRTADDKQWIVSFLMDDGPVRYFKYDRASKKAEFLFTNRKDLEGVSLMKMQPHIIKSRDGMNLVSYLTLPKESGADSSGKPKKPVPMVLLVHGGPWARDQWGLNPMHQFYANRGYAVLSVNFRGSTGFGKQFLNAGNKEWAGKMHDDLLDAVEWAVGRNVAQSDKIAIVGGSYGGYATLVGLTFTPDTFACGVDIVGPSNIVTLLNTIPPYWAPMVQMFKDRVGDHTSEAGKMFLAERSPLTHVEKIRKPLLIAQGANDPRVKQSESDQIVKAMQDKKIPVTYVLFPDEGHGFQRPNNSLAFNAVTEAFLAKFLGGRYEAIGDAFNGSSITVPAGAEAVPGVGGKLPARSASR